jgi:hypothetical protein
VDDRAPGAAISVNERVDRLELSVSDRRLRHDGQVVGVGKGAEILDQLCDRLRGRRNVVRRAGVVVAATDPVLLLPEAPCIVVQTRTREQASMNLQQQLHGDLAVEPDLLYSAEHRVDVAEHLRGRHVGGWLGRRAERLGMQQMSRADLQALDARGGHGLRAQQDAGERLGVDQTRGLGVQAGDRSLGVGDIGGDIAVEHEATTDQWIWHVGCVIAVTTVSTRDTAARDLALPAAIQKLRHQISLLELSIQPPIRQFVVGGSTALNRCNILAGAWRAIRAASLNE